MDALTPDRRALRTLIRGNELPSCPDQVSLVHLARPSMHSVTNHPACSVVALSLPLQRNRRPCFTLNGSGFTLNEEARRTTRPNRVRYPTDCMFASGCSPPRLTATQLPSATGMGILPGEDFHLSNRACSPGALIPAEAESSHQWLHRFPAFGMTKKGRFSKLSHYHFHADTQAGRRNSEAGGWRSRSGRREQGRATEIGALSPISQA